MKRFCGFSLAEALIVLLIVAIIAAASVPVITKKKRTPQARTEVLWNVSKDGMTSISPAYSRDIMLGNLSLDVSQGIVVADELVFKNREGEIIGWIKEDGTSSFVNTERIIAKQNEILSMLQTLTESLERAISESNQYGSNTDTTRTQNDSGINLLKNPPKANGGITGRERLLNPNLNGRNHNKNGISSNITDEQLAQIANLQKQLQMAFENRS